MLGHLVDLFQIGRDELAAMLLREARQMIFVIRVENDVGAMPRRHHLDGRQVAQRVNRVRAVFAHTAVHIAQAVARAVDGEPRLARELRHAVIEEARPLPAFSLPVDAAIETRGAVEARHIGANAQAHAEAFARFAADEIARRAAHGRRGNVAIEQGFVVAEAARGKNDALRRVDINLVLEILLGDQAHDTARFVLHKRLGGATENEFNALGYAVIVHGVGRVFHFQHVVVERGILRRNVHRHFAQAPLHAAIGHPVKRVAAFARDFIDELRVGRVVVFVHRPIGERFGVERIARECEALFFLLRIAAQNAAHAGRLRIAAP